ncbi:formate dehydrogenase accessory protein FdhE [Pseudomonas sp. BS3782 TE3695]
MQNGQDLDSICHPVDHQVIISFEDDRHAANQAPLRAEVCPGCNSYLKLIYLENDAEAEALSADLSSLMLDMRLEQEGYQRLSPNLMLAPGGD